MPQDAEALRPDLLSALRPRVVVADGTLLQSHDLDVELGVSGHEGCNERSASGGPRSPVHSRGCVARPRAPTHRRVRGRDI